MKGVEATPEEQERLATGNNNGSLVCKLPEPEEPDSCAAFHSTRIFMLVFLSGWVLQGMFLTYFVSVTTTIEKLFKVESKTTGTLLAATEIGQICTALFLTYLAGRGHRPRWIACMMLVLAVGVIGCMMPHMAYGTELLEVHLDSHTAGAGPVCALDKNSSLIKCDDAQVQSTKTRSSITAVVIPWLFICLLVVGVGQTGIATLGIPYVDDNVGSRQSPLYMAITIGIRVIGPALGFMLGALCTRVYVDPLADPGYDNTDPRWVGAWWLGLLFSGIPSRNCHLPLRSRSPRWICARNSQRKHTRDLGTNRMRVQALAVKFAFQQPQRHFYCLPDTVLSPAAKTAKCPKWRSAKRALTRNKEFANTHRMVSVYFLIVRAL
ncbi:Solute carrier organic anion transporter family member 3A1 [Papilio xuthus]|uniref:Solute carrier organic anion transporter family member 3A1 n=1 Tax=Papilio xuthus TaxID=66420 RepID=A0A194Q3Z6_PAPXU|nr:Solute carrier organic anion transporter family member 3A1 [Papilio xuthus]